MPGRNFNVNTYRYGANSGSERDDEITGVVGSHYTTEFRELDTRLGGRWWSPDRIVKPWESPYAGFSNNPIYYSDPSGLDKETATKKEKNNGGKDAKGTQYDGSGNTRSNGNTTQTLDPGCDCYVNSSVGGTTNTQNASTNNANVLAPALPTLGGIAEATVGATAGIVVGAVIALPLATGATLHMPEHEQGDWIVYKINYIETETNTGMPVSSGVYKYGISGQPGYSEKPGHPRPELQVNSLNATEALLVNEGVVSTEFTYSYNIIASGISQLSAEFIEQEMVNMHYAVHGEAPDGNKRPLPDALRGRTRSKFQKLDKQSVDKIKDFINTLTK